MKQMFLAIAALLLAAPQGHAESDQKAWIEVTEADSAVTIKVLSDLDIGVGGTYQLEVIKAGPSGRSVSRQGGMVQKLDTAERQTASVSRVSVEPGATLDVSLTVEDDAGHVYEDSFSKTY